MKKPYLVTVEVRDGEHEHYSRAIYWAETMQIAENWADSQCIKGFECDGIDAYFGYGDGLTATKFESVHELTKQEVKMLERLGVVYSVN